MGGGGGSCGLSMFANRNFSQWDCQNLSRLSAIFMYIISVTNKIYKKTFSSETYHRLCPTIFSFINIIRTECDLITYCTVQYTNYFQYISKLTSRDHCWNICIPRNVMYCANGFIFKSQTRNFLQELAHFGVIIDFSET